MSKIPIKKAKELIHAFKQDKSGALNQIVEDTTRGSKNPNTKDARFSYYSLDDLETYITYLRNSKKGIKGVNIYLGQYNESNGPGPEYNGLTTTVFVPAKKEPPKSSDGFKTMIIEEESDDLEGNNNGQTGFPPGGGI